MSHFSFEMDFTREDIRKLIYYNWKRGLVPAKIADEINSTLGRDTTNERTCRRCVAKFKEENLNVEDQDRCGRPSYGIDDKIRTLLVEHTTTREMSLEIGVCQQTIRNHLLGMGMRYLCNRRVPHKLSEEQITSRERICNELLSKHVANDFLGQLITMDKLWIYWDNGGTYHHRSWRGEGDVPDGGNVFFLKSNCFHIRFKLSKLIFQYKLAKYHGRYSIVIQNCKTIH